MKGQAERGLSNPVSETANGDRWLTWPPDLWSSQADPQLRFEHAPFAASEDVVHATVQVLLGPSSLTAMPDRAAHSATAVFKQ
jgi:hypothetical protein